MRTAGWKWRIEFQLYNIPSLEGWPSQLFLYVAWSVWLSHVGFPFDCRFLIDRPPGRITTHSVTWGWCASVPRPLSQSPTFIQLASPKNVGTIFRKRMRDRRCQPNADSDDNVTMICLCWSSCCEHKLLPLVFGAVWSGAVPRRRWIWNHTNAALLLRLLLLLLLVAVVVVIIVVAGIYNYHIVNCIVSATATTAASIDISIASQQQPRHDDDVNDFWCWNNGEGSKGRCCQPQRRLPLKLEF